MKITDIDESLELEWQASKELCRSSRPNSKLGASALASCKSQGLRTRSGRKSHKISKVKSTADHYRTIANDVRHLQR